VYKIEDIISTDAVSFLKEKKSIDLNKILLSADKYPGLKVPLLVDQIRAKEKAKTKLPNWYANEGIVYPPMISMEQCSSERTAMYKARLVHGKTFIDLTGGTGIDTMFLSKKFDRGTYIEQQEWLVRCFQHNSQKLGVNNLEIIHGDGIDFITNHKDEDFDLVYLDPARRDSQKKKVIFLEDCTPDVSDIQDQLLGKTKRIMVKFSPMLDIQYVINKLPHVKEIHVVAVDNECKELLVLMENGYKKETKIIATNMNKGKEDSFSFFLSEEKRCEISMTGTKQYLYEPNAAILKTGAFKYLANQYDLEKLSEHTHLYSSEILKRDFPGKIYEVKASYKPNKKVVSSRLKGIKLSIKTRNYPSTPAVIRKKHKLLDGDDLNVFFCKVLDEYVVIEGLKV